MQTVVIGNHGIIKKRVITLIRGSKSPLSIRHYGLLRSITHVLNTQWTIAKCGIVIYSITRMSRKKQINNVINAILTKKLAKPRPPWLLVTMSHIFIIMATSALKFSKKKDDENNEMFTCEWDILTKLILGTA